MKTHLKKFWLIIKVFFVVILECLIITLPIYLNLSLYIGVVVSNILTFMLALVSAGTFRQLGRQLADNDTEATEQEETIEATESNDSEL